MLSIKERRPDEQIRQSPGFKSSSFCWRGATRRSAFLGAADWTVWFFVVVVVVIVVVCVCLFVCFPRREEGPQREGWLLTSLPPPQPGSRSPARPPMTPLPSSLSSNGWIPDSPFQEAGPTAPHPSHHRFSVALICSVAPSTFSPS